MRISNALGSSLRFVVAAGALAAAACDGCNPPPPAQDAGCTAGAQGCACNAGACNAGLDCIAGTCQPAVQRAGLRVSDASARSCEVLLAGTSGLDVEFAASVKGKAVREGDRVAVAFVSTGDAAIADGAVNVVRQAGSTTSPGAVTIVAATCFDVDGSAISGATVALQPGT